MPTLLPKITEQGLQAAIDADNAGMQIYIDAISFGSGLYDPVGTETALVSQHVKLPIASGGKVAPTQVRVSAVWQDAVSLFNIGEIGFWTGTTLFAVWSRATGGYVAVKSPDIDFVALYDLTLGAVPPNSVNVIVNTEVNEALAVLAEHIVDPNAHPASAITFDQGRTVQQVNDTSLAVSDPLIQLAVGNDNFITENGTYKLPSSAGLSLGDKVYLSKKTGLLPIVEVEGSGGESILIAKYPEEVLSYTSFIYSINAGVMLRWSGDNWELN